MIGIPGFRMKSRCSGDSRACTRASVVVRICEVAFGILDLQKSRLRIQERQPKDPGYGEYEGTMGGSFQNFYKDHQKLRFAL